MSLPDFWGNHAVVSSLEGMIESGRLAQTILLSGPDGVGKATLARRFAARLLGTDANKIEADDLSLPGNQAVIEEREKWPADKRADDPLLFGTHPDFLTFAPEGPLRQITIQQMRELRERARFRPLRGAHRVFLVDRLDRANEQAANSLLKILEEPPAHLVVIATAENVYDLLATIRSRALIFQLAPLSDSEMESFASSRQLDDTPLRIALAEGCPGLAARLDVETFRNRRNLLLSLFECAAGLTPFSSWLQASEPFNVRRSEKLDLYTGPAYDLLEDVLAASQRQPLKRNRDIPERVNKLASRITFGWLEQAVREVDELVLMVRRNIQKTAALDAMIIKLRNRLQSANA